MGLYWNLICCVVKGPWHVLVSYNDVRNIVETFLLQAKRFFLRHQWKSSSLFQVMFYLLGDKPLFEKKKFTYLLSNEPVETYVNGIWIKIQKFTRKGI